jgi:hypothetical protein
MSTKQLCLLYSTLYLKLHIYENGNAYIEGDTTHVPRSKFGRYRASISQSLSLSLSMCLCVWENFGTVCMFCMDVCVCVHSAQ